MKYISGYCKGEKCFCGKEAKHKLEETVFDDDPNPNRHNLTAYVCCEHYQLIMGNFAKLQCLNLEH